MTLRADIAKLLSDRERLNAFLSDPEGLKKLVEQSDEPVVDVIREVMVMLIEWLGSLDDAILRIVDEIEKGTH